MDQKKTTVIRLAASVASGWLALLLAQFPLVIDSIYSVSIYWSLILPLMISWAWGAEYAAIACTLGGVCAIPFIQTPEFGMGNILISSFCVVAFLFRKTKTQTNDILHRNDTILRDLLCNDKLHAAEYPDT